jgi:CDP-diacylglycerol--glycerol-3-phosphate 3-phosphatidyltransferase
MLDGAVARVGRLGTRAGAVLDSSVDRFSDMAIYFGCFLYFARLTEPNLTYQVLALIALCNGVLISYVKARAEEMIDDCSVGYWLRGERFAAVLIGCTFGHIPAVLWQMSVSCLFTVARRMAFAYTTVQALDAGRPLPPRGPSPGWLGKLQLWRRPRGSVAYDIVTGAHIAFIIAGPLLWPALLGTGPTADPLRALLGQP